MEALEKNTARLPTVEIVPPPEIVGRSTVEGIQSGLYFGNRVAIEGLTREIREQAFRRRAGPGHRHRRILAPLRARRALRRFAPDLVLVGLERALSLNAGASRPWRESPGDSGA